MGLENGVRPAELYYLCIYAGLTPEREISPDFFDTFVRIAELLLTHICSKNLK